MSDKIMKEMFQRALAIREAIVADRRYLHENAEIGCDLPKTVAHVKRRLAEMGVEAADCSPSGVRACIRGARPGGTILLRGDMDALPMTEESGVAFASRGKAAHTCGHDMHTAMLLGAAALLKGAEAELCGTVTLMFQPGEEILAGAKAMIEAGILENPKVDAALALHVASDYPLGSFGYRKGYSNASSDSFYIDIKGRGCHGAMPHRGIDPINVAAHIHIALQEIPAREIDATESAVLTIGELRAGSATNIIPESAHMKGTLRAYSPEVRALALRRIGEICAGIGGAFGAEVAFSVPQSAPSLCNDAEITGFAVAMLENAGIENFALFEKRSMGAEDFAFVAERVPSVLLSIGAGASDERLRIPLHNPKVVFDEGALPLGAALYAAFAKSRLACANPA